MGQNYMSLLRNNFARCAATVFIFFIVGDISAQNLSHKIFPISSSKQHLDSDDYTQLQNLLLNVNDAIYNIDSKQTTHGKNPVVYYTNVNDPASVQNNKLNSNEIKLIHFDASTFKIPTLDVAVFRDFQKLKFLYFLLAHESQVNQLQSVMSETDLNVVVFYEIINRS